VWHFHPFRFIQQFRRCGWLSADELVATFPKYIAYELPHGHATYTAVTDVASEQVSPKTMHERTKNYVIPLNRSMRKYGLSCSRTRQAHFLGQVSLETGRWFYMKEDGSGADNPRIPMAKYYGAFFGRGILQLTWAGLFDDYGKFRKFSDNVEGTYGDARITRTSTHYWEDPTKNEAKPGETPRIVTTGTPRLWYPRFDPAKVNEAEENECDSGGFYWVYKHHAGHRDINRIADQRFDSETIGKISVLVNGGGNGYFERQAYSQVAARQLTDDVSTKEIVNYAPPTKKQTISVDFSRIK